MSARLVAESSRHRYAAKVNSVRGVVFTNMKEDAVGVEEPITIRCALNVEKNSKPFIRVKTIAPDPAPLPIETFMPIITKSNTSQRTALSVDGSLPIESLNLRQPVLSPARLRLEGGAPRRWKRCQRPPNNYGRTQSTDPRWLLFINKNQMGPKRRYRGFLKERDSNIIGES